LPPAVAAAAPLDQRHAALAVGRVAAHELVHVIVPAWPHARSGLMAPWLDRSALTGASVSLDLATRDALCAALDTGSGERLRQARIDVDSPAPGGTHWP
jgi:hypothetical protein